MKPRHAAALALCVGLSACGRLLSHQWSLLDWFGLCVIFLIILIVGIGLAGLAKTIRK
jgi:hypothetical protein